MKTYKDEYCLLAHLHRYAWYWLQRIRSAKHREAERMEALDEAIVGGHVSEPSETMDERENVEEILKFRQFCMEREKVVFEYVLANGFQFTTEELEILRNKTGLSDYRIRSLIFSIRKFVVPFTTGRTVPGLSKTKADAPLPSSSSPGDSPGPDR